MTSAENLSDLSRVSLLGVVVRTFTVPRFEEPFVLGVLFHEQPRIVADPPIIDFEFTLTLDHSLPTNPVKNAFRGVPLPIRGGDQRELLKGLVDLRIRTVIRFKILFGPFSLGHGSPLLNRYRMPHARSHGFTGDPR